MLNKYQIYDSKAEAHQLPFYSPTRGVAQRLFHQAANDPTQPIGRYGADYTLFEVACWDPNTGLETPHPSHINLGTALSVRDVEE